MRTLSNLAKFFIICAAVFFVGLVCTIIGVAAGGFDGINKIAEKYDWIQGDPGERTVISQTVEDFQSVAVTGDADYWIVGRDFYKSEKWLADQDLLTEKEAALIEPNQVSIICGENADKPEIKVEKGVLTIDAGAKDVSGISFSTSDAPWNPEVLICVPDEVLESLTASSEIGDINCLGVAWKNARIELNTGNVNMEGVRSGGLVAETDTGDANLQGKFMERLQAKTDTGDIEIDTTLAKAEYGLDLKADSGEITISEPGQDDREIDEATATVKEVGGPHTIIASTDTGEINLSFQSD